MGASDLKKDEGIGCSSKEKIANGSRGMDIDDIDLEDEDDILNLRSIEELGGGFLKKFCKKASTAFFEQYGLISHQLNSYNDFIKYGIQDVFDSVGEIIVEPGFDPSKRGDVVDWRYASLKFGKVSLEKPDFWASEKYVGEGGNVRLNLLPRHARLQNMTYAATIKVETHIQVNAFIWFK